MERGCCAQSRRKGREGRQQRSWTDTKGWHGNGRLAEPGRLWSARKSSQLRRRNNLSAIVRQANPNCLPPSIRQTYFVAGRKIRSPRAKTLP